jgi:sigma-B regulation protein RsbU (phosphoserine phosphatase)
MSSRRSRRKRKARLAIQSPKERHASLEGWVRSSGKFLREYTAGLNRREIKRLFDRDASTAYSVLTREHAQLPEPKGRWRRLLFRTRLAFLGLSYKLTPARRLVFALSLVCLVVALMTGTYTYSSVVHGRTVHVSVDFSPFWFMLASGGLVFLLALELVDRVRVRDELQVARELQAELLPHGAIELPGYRFAHSYRTANEVGGDYYEVLRLPDGRAALMVGDATGHGMASGLVMAIANATLKTALDLDPDPSRVAALLNRTLCRTGTRRTFMTVFYALLAPATGDLVSFCAGHPFPLLRRAGGQVEELGRGGLPLGVHQELAPEPLATALAPGDLLVLYTDGLAEAVNAQDEAFGYDRIEALVRPGGKPQEVHDRILAAFDAHVGEEPLRDDLTLLVVARDGDAARQPSSGGLPSAASGNLPWAGGNLPSAGGDLPWTGGGLPSAGGGRASDEAGRTSAGGGRTSAGDTAAKVAAMAAAINRGELGLPLGGGRRQDDPTAPEGAPPGGAGATEAGDQHQPFEPLPGSSGERRGDPSGAPGRARPGEAAGWPVESGQGRPGNQIPDEMAKAQGGAPPSETRGAQPDDGPRSPEDKSPREPNGTPVAGDGK